MSNETKNEGREREKLISPLPRGGCRISSSAFLSRRPFGYYLPIASSPEEIEITNENQNEELGKEN